MSDFRARIEAFADLGKATSDIDSFVNKARKLKVDVDLNLTGAGQNFAGILSQLQNQARSSGTSAGSQWASGFNSSLGRINVSATTEQIKDLKGSLSNGFQFDSKSVNNITKEIGDMGVEVERVQTKLNSKGGMNVSVKGTDQLQRAVTVTKTYNDKSEEVASTLNIVATAEKKATQQATARANVTDKVAKAEKMASKAQLEIAGNNLTAWASKNTKATAAFGERIRTLQEEMKGMQDSGATAQQFKEWSDNVKVLKSEANATGNVGKTFADSFGSAFSSMVKFAASYVSIRKVFSEMENGIRTVVALDDALVDLQKTTTATPQQLNNFYNEANNIAKQYGTTTQQIIQGTADWSRLGYSLEDSKTMSKLSSQFAAISPGMSVEESTNSLVSTMKAFGIEADDTLDGIMSKVNIVGNNFALSNADVMTALKNSSASMAAANATFEETVALITAGQEIAQDSSKVGNALRTISMRIRGMNEETQELDGSLQTIGGDVYDLTNGKVSIMLDPETYKSPYKILQEISHVWDELTDVQHAELAEKLFGKNRANIGIAVIENFKQAEAAMDAMNNSAGAADKEMDIITNSLTYKLNALRETGTGIWQNLFQRDEIGGVVDDLTALLGVVEALTEKIGLIGTAVGIGGGAVAIFKYLKAFKTLSDVGKSTKFIDVAAEAFAPMKAGVDAYSEALTAGSSKMLAFGAGAKAMIASLMPLIGVLAAIGIAFAAFKGFDYLNSGWTRAQESAQKAVAEFDDAKTKLDDINKEKTDNLSKVQEIAAKYDIQVDGMDDVDEMIEKINSSDKGISLVDKVELEKLSSANKQLEAQAKIQEQIVNAKKQAAIAETENAAQIEKSYWEEVKGRHKGGIFGAAASVLDYLGLGYKPNWSNEEGNEKIQFEQEDTTNIGLAQKAYDDLIAKKQELQQLNQEIENSKGGVTDEQIKRHEDLTKEIAEQASKAGTLMNTVSSELDVLSQSDSKFAKDYVKQAKQLLLDFSNIDASPAEVALNTINSFFDGTFGKNAIKEELIDAMESGQDLEETLQGLGLSMEDFGNIDKSYLTDYFEDLTKSAEEAKEATDDFHVSIEDISEATKSANKDADWTTMQSAYKSAGELLKEGKTGTDDFQTVAQFFTDKNLKKLSQDAKDAGGYAADVYQKAFEDAQAQADRWFGSDETKSMENFVDDMSNKGLFNVNKSDEKGLWDIESQFKTTAEAAKELGTSTGVVETMLSALESYGYDFSGIERSGEMLSEYQQTLEALKQTYDSMGEGEAKEKLGKLIEGFDTEYEGFKDDLSNLTEEQVVHIKFEYDLASIQSKIDEVQELINGGDNSVENNAQLIAANNQYIKTAEKGLGLGEEGVQLPVQYVIADNAEASLREQLKEATPEEKVGIQTKIENQQEIKKDILDTFADEHPEITPETNVEEINSALADTFAEKTIVFKASVDGVEQAVSAYQNKDGTIIYTANVDGVQTEVQQVQNEDGTITYTANVENEPKGDELNKKGTLEYEAKVNDSGVTKDKSAKVSFTKDSSAADNYKPGDKQAKVVFTKDSSAPDNYSPSDKYATVNYSANTSGLPSSFPTITRYVNYVKTGDGGVDGTAHANGTAFSRGTARKGVAFARGNWGTKRSGVALGGELGEEIVVFKFSHIA